MPEELGTRVHLRSFEQRPYLARVSALRNVINPTLGRHRMPGMTRAMPIAPARVSTVRDAAHRRDPIRTNATTIRDTRRRGRAPTLRRDRSHICPRRVA